MLVVVSNINVAVSPTALNSICVATFTFVFDSVALLPATTIIMCLICPTTPSAMVNVAVPLPVFKNDTPFVTEIAFDPPEPVIVSVVEYAL